MITILAPPRLASDELARSVQTFLSKADQPARSEAQHEFALWSDLFDFSPVGGSAAALTRQLDAGDAGDMQWLRADPAHFRVEMANVRMLACGDVGQTERESEQLIRALAPHFGDEGFELRATHPSRWYLRAFASNAASDLPSLAPPNVALGQDLFELWPEDDIHRRWRRLFNEAQIVLAQHPVNRERISRGLPAINGLWFWGGGRLPTKMPTKLSVVMTSDHLLAALATFAGATCMSIFDPDRVLAGGDALIDLRHAENAEGVLVVILQAWQDGLLRELEWRSPSGRWLRKRWHRWRFWR